MDRVVIRDESERDHAAVRELHRLAFGSDVEAALVEALRLSGDVMISLVAERQGRPSGHVLFSRLEAPMRALALAPLAVLPEAQNQGIGTALVRQGLARADQDGWQAVFVLGEPAYYRRFGFSQDAARPYACPYSGDYFMMMRLGVVAIPSTGTLTYAAPFRDLE